MELGEYIFMRIAIVFLVVAVVWVIRFAVALIKTLFKSLFGGKSEEKLQPKPAPQIQKPAVQQPPKPAYTPPAPVQRQAPPAPQPAPATMVTPSPQPAAPTTAQPYEGTVPLDPGKMGPLQSRPSGYRLRGINGQFAGQMISLMSGEACTLGRNPSCDIVFAPDTPGVSGIHCRVEARQVGGLYITDCGSTYGTYLHGGSYNGMRLIPNQPAMVGEGSADQPVRLYLAGQNGPCFQLEREW